MTGPGVRIEPRAAELRNGGKTLIFQVDDWTRAEACEPGAGYTAIDE